MRQSAPLLQPDKPAKFSVTTKIKQRWPQIVVMLLMLVVVIIGISLITLKEISVQGTLDPKALETTAKGALEHQLFGSNLALLRASGVKRDILRVNGERVTNITVKKDLFHRQLVITATDREPSAVWQSNSKLYEIDQTGRAAKQVSDAGTLPLVIDQTNVPLSSGSQVVSAEFVKFLENVRVQLPNKIQNLTVKHFRVGASTKELSVDTSAGYYLVLDTNREIGEQLDNLAKVLDLAKAKNQMPTQYVDLRIPYKAYYK